MYQEKETTSSKKIILTKQKNNITNKSRMGRKSKVAIIVGMIMGIVLIITSGIFLVSLNNKESYSDNLENIVNSAPPNSSSGKLDGWAKSNIQSMKQSKLSQTNNKEDLTKYYNQLYNYYSLSYAGPEPRDVYLSQVKPKKILLDIALLEWLIKTSSVGDTQYQKSLIEDVQVILQQQLADANSQDVPELKEKINYYNEVLKVLK